jgi:hypothetical protein
MTENSAVILGRSASARRAEDLWTEERLNLNGVLGSAFHAARG